MGAKRNPRRGNWLLLGAALLVALALGGAWLWKELSSPYRGFSGAEVFVEIPRGASSNQIAQLLADAGVVRSRAAFAWLCRLRGRNRLQAGEYRFDQPLSALDVFDKLLNGRVHTRPLVVPEGFTMFDIAALVEREGFTTSAEFLAAARDTELVRDLAPEAASLEGFLFPSRYDFQRRMKAQNITAAMVRQFRQVWSRVAAGLSPDGMPVLERVTMASLVEKETSVDEERALVAGVYFNRLRKGILLQCDPTVIYAQLLAGRWDGNLTLADLKFKSPYNTYVNAGLPPGPIANPGEAALRAAVSPAMTDYFYFVADAKGGHVFAKTLQEHNRNVRAYLQQRAENRRAAAQAGKNSGKAAKLPRRGS